MSSSAMNQTVALLDFMLLINLTIGANLTLHFLQYLYGVGLISRRYKMSIGDHNCSLVVQTTPFCPGEMSKQWCALYVRCNPEIICVGDTSEKGISLCRLSLGSMQPASRSHCVILLLNSFNCVLSHRNSQLLFILCYSVLWRPNNLLAAITFVHRNIKFHSVDRLYHKFGVSLET